MSVLLDYSPIINRCRKLASTGRAIFQSYNNALLSVIGGASQATAFAPVLAMLVDARWVSLTSLPNLTDNAQHDTSLISDVADRIYLNAVFTPTSCSSRTDNGATAYGLAFTDQLIGQIDLVIKQTVAAVGGSASYYAYLPMHLNAFWGDPVRPIWKCKTVRYYSNYGVVRIRNSGDPITIDTYVYPCKELSRIRIVTNAIKTDNDTSQFISTPYAYVASDMWSNLEKIADLFSYFQTLINQYFTLTTKTIELRGIESAYIDDPPDVSVGGLNYVQMTVRPRVGFALESKYVNLLRPFTPDWVDIFSPIRRIGFNYYINFM